MPAARIVLREVRRLISDWGQVMKALGQPTRLEIVLRLARQEHCVCELQRLLPASQSAISQHLRILKAAGLVSERRVGQWTYYSLNKADLKRTLDAIAQALDDPLGLTNVMIQTGIFEGTAKGTPKASERS